LELIVHFSPSLSVADYRFMLAILVDFGDVIGMAEMR
jgi:hypothetical protein